MSVDFEIIDCEPQPLTLGDAAEIGGPRGSAVAPHDFDRWLLVGDETALPAIGRRIEERPAGNPVISAVSVTGPADEKTVVTVARHRAIWIHRPTSQADDPSLILNHPHLLRQPTFELRLSQALVPRQRRCTIP